MALSQKEFSLSYNALPKPIRSYIISPEFNAAIDSLAKKYSLHVDVAGTFGDAVTQLIMGLMTPAQVNATLTVAGMAPDVSKKILEEVNKSIFVPLSDKVKHFTETGEDLVSPPQIVEDVAPTPGGDDTAPTTYNQGNTAEGGGALPTVSEPPARHINKIETTPVVKKIAPAQPRVSTPVPPTHVTEQAQVRTMASDMEAVKEHRAPSPFFMRGGPTIATPPRLPVVPTGPSARIAPIVPTPIASVAQAPIVQAPSTPEVVQTPSPLPIQPTRTAPPPSNLPGTPIVKAYAQDPYRELPE